MEPKTAQPQMISLSRSPPTPPPDFPPDAASRVVPYIAHCSAGKKPSDVCNLTACNELSLIVSQVSAPDYNWPFLKL